MTELLTAAVRHPLKNSMEAAGIEETRDEKNLFAARVVISHRLDFFRPRSLPLPSRSTDYRRKPRPRGTYAEHETGLHFAYRAWTLLQKRKNELFEIEINNVNFMFLPLLLVQTKLARNRNPAAK